MKLLKRLRFFSRNNLLHQYTQRRFIECRVEDSKAYIHPVVPTLQGYSLGVEQYKEQSQTSSAIRNQQ